MIRIGWFQNAAARIMTGTRRRDIIIILLLLIIIIILYQQLLLSLKHIYIHNYHTYCFHCTASLSEPKANRSWQMAAHIESASRGFFQVIRELFFSPQSPKCCSLWELCGDVCYTGAYCGGYCTCSRHVVCSQVPLDTPATLHSSLVVLLLPWTLFHKLHFSMKLSEVTVCVCWEGATKEIWITLWNRSMGVSPHHTVNIDILSSLLWQQWKGQFFYCLLSSLHSFSVSVSASQQTYLHLLSRNRSLRNEVLVPQCIVSTHYSAEAPFLKMLYDQICRHHE